MTLVSYWCKKEHNFSLSPFIIFSNTHLTALSVLVISSLSVTQIVVAYRSFSSINTWCRLTYRLLLICSMPLNLQLLWLILSEMHPFGVIELQI